MKDEVSNKTHAKDYLTEFLGKDNPDWLKLLIERVIKKSGNLEQEDKDEIFNKLLVENKLSVDAVEKESLSEVEYTTGNYDEKGDLIKKKIPTVTSEVGEIGVINGSYYLVLIFERNKLTKEFLSTLYQISECKIYGFKDFMKSLDLEAIFQEDLDESYIQIQFDGITTKQNHFLVELHYKLRKHFGEYEIYPINQIHKNMKL